MTSFKRSARTRLWQVLRRRRDRLRGGGGLADALHKLLDTQCSDQHGVADDDDAWLREQLQSLLKQKPNAGTLLAGLRRILQQAEAWQQRSVPSRWKSRRKASAHDQVAQGQKGRWKTAKQDNGASKAVDDRWHLVKWRPRPQEFGTPDKVRLFHDIVELSDYLDEMSDKMEDVGEFHLYSMLTMR